VPFPPLFNLFRVPLNVLVRIPGGTPNPGLESLMYIITVCNGNVAKLSMNEFCLSHYSVLMHEKY
jgi:hypothetical protein